MISPKYFQLLRNDAWMKRFMTRNRAMQVACQGLE